MSSRKFLVLLTLTAFLTASFTLFSPGSPRAADVEPRVERLMKAMADYLKEAKEYTFKAEINVDDILPSGQKIQYAANYMAGIKRPDKIRTSNAGDLRNTGVWYNGKTFTLLNKDRNFYAQWPAPDNIDDLLVKLEEKLGVRVPLSSLFHNDPYEHMMAGVEVGAYAGLHLVGETPCHHLVFSQKEVDAQVWIEEGKQLVPRKIVLTFKTLPGEPQFTAVIKEWDFNPRLSDLIFSFDPPPGASKVEFKEVDK